MLELSLRLKAPSRRFSSTERRGKICRPSGEWASPIVTMSWAWAPWIGLPWNVIEPPVGFSNPEMVRSVVVLPAPLVPMSVTT